MTVEVDVTPEPETPADDAPDVVVVDTGDSGNSDDIAVGVMLGTLTTRVEELIERVNVIDTRTMIAENTAEQAVEEVADVVEEVAEVVAEALAEDGETEPVEADTTPDKVHWAHRGRGELFGKGEN